MDKKQLPRFYSIQEIERAYDMGSHGFWFSTGSMKFFKTRFTQHFAMKNEKEYLFITTEKGPFENSKRMASLRTCILKPSKKKFCGYTMTIETIGDFNIMTIPEAQKLMKKILSEGKKK